MKRSHKTFGLVAVFSAALLLAAFGGFGLLGDNSSRATSANPYLNHIPARMRSAYEDEQGWFAKTSTALIQGDQERADMAREKWKVAQKRWCARISEHAAKTPPASAIPISAAETAPYTLSDARIVDEPTTAFGAEANRPCRHGLYVVAKLTLNGGQAERQAGSSAETLFFQAVDQNGNGIPGTEVPLWGGVVDRSGLDEGQPVDVLIRWSMRQAANMDNFAGAVQITRDEYQLAYRNRNGMEFLASR
jgi:hypothetical protein